MVRSKKGTVKKQPYSVKIGLQKTGKNVLWTFVLPAFVYILDSVRDFVPDEYLPIVLPIAGALSYFLKNYISNR